MDSNISDLHESKQMKNTSNFFGLKICSFNMHGFNSGLSLAKILCSDYDLIFLQEHWLLKQDLYKLDMIDSNFKSNGLSSMDQKSESGILVGRPFGGVGCLWRKNLSNSISMIQSNASHGRLISINLKFGSLDIIITNTYFPYYKHSMDYNYN